MDKHEDEKQRMARGPQIQMPNPITAGVKRALNLPVFALVRFPIPGGKWQYDFQRIS